MRVFLIALFFLVGCQQKTVVRHQTGLDGNAFWKEQERRLSAFQNYSAKITLRYKGKKESVSGNGTVLVDPHLGSRMELRDPLGRIHYVLLSKKDTATAYYPRESVAYVDTKKGTRYFERLLGLNLSVEEMRLFWLGILDANAKLTPFEWNEMEGTYSTSFLQGGNEYFLEIHPDTAAIVRLKVKKLGSIFFVHYEEFEKERNIEIAHEVNFESKELGTKIEVEWDHFSAFPKDIKSQAFELEENSKIRKVSLK